MSYLLYNKRKIPLDNKANAIAYVNETTIVDIDLGAKTRGIFKPISFHIDKNRE